MNKWLRASAVLTLVALAMMVIIMVVGNTGNPVLIGYTTLALYAVVLVTILDGFLMWRRLKKALLAKFGTNLTIKPLRWYAVARAFQIRRARLRYLAAPQPRQIQKTDEKLRALVMRYFPGRCTWPRLQMLQHKLPALLAQIALHRLLARSGRSGARCP